MYLFITVEVKHGSVLYDLHRVCVSGSSSIEDASWKYMRAGFHDFGEMCDPEGIWWKYLGDGLIPEEFIARMKTIKEIPKEQFSMLYQLFEGE